MRPALLHAIWFGVVCRRALCGDYAGDEWTVQPREGAPCARSVSGTPGQVLQVTACDLVSSMDESAQEPRQGQTATVLVWCGKSAKHAARTSCWVCGLQQCAGVCAAARAFDRKRQRRAPQPSRMFRMCMCSASRGGAAHARTRAAASAPASPQRHTWLEATVCERSCGPRGTGPLPELCGRPAVASERAPGLTPCPPPRQARCRAG